MFLKVIKNNFINSWKDFALVYVLGLVLSLLTVIAVETQLGEQAPVLASLFIFLVFGLLVSILVLSIRATLKLMYSSLYTIDPVLTWTQPVSSTMVLSGKMITGAIWSLVSTAVTFIIGYLLLSYIFSKSGTDMTTVGSVLSAVIRIDDSVLPIYILSTLVTYIFYTSIVILVGAFVNSSFIRSRRVMIAIILGFIINFGVTQLVQFVAPEGLFTYQAIKNPSFDISTLAIALNDSLGYVFSFFGIYIAFSILFFFLAVKLIDNKLEV